MKNALTLLWILFSIGTQAQAPDFNVELLAEVYPGNDSNDIWGYVDTDGTEYALLGTTEEVYIYRLSDPTNPELVAQVPGHTSIWRDIKSFDHYIYITTDRTNDMNPDGLVVVDMSNIASDEISFERINTFTGNGDLTTTFGTCHNLSIDVPNGLLVLSGCDDNSGGLLFFDLNEDPSRPKLILKGPPIKSHDNVTQGGYTYSCDLARDLNIINSSTGEIVATQMTGRDFTHNAWPSDDGNFIFTTDEVRDGYVESYDISDLENIEFLDRYQPLASDNTGVYPHNTHYYNGYLVTSYYTDGLKIIDANKPDNLVEVGSFDTWFNKKIRFHGLWGAYPYLPSGLILGSDIERGLIVWRPTYQRAMYIMGDVVDAQTGNIIFEAEITLENDLLSSKELTDVEGNFKTGIAQDPDADENSVVLTVQKEGYGTYQETINLTPGECPTIHVELNAGSSVTGQVTDVETSSGLNEAEVYLTNGLDVFQYSTDEVGNFVGPIFPGDYSGFVGRWGYDLQVISGLSIEEGGHISFQLEPGEYRDDFALDLGWTSVHGGTAGFWELAEPIGTVDEGNQSNPEMDTEGDLGDECYITGNGGGIAPNDDIDGGTNRLFSPEANVSTYAEPRLTFDYWFYIGGGNSEFNDSLKVKITDGDDIQTIFITGDANSNWISSPIFDLAQIGLNLDNPIQVIFEASDISPGHIVEAGVDRVHIYDALATSADDILDENLVIVKNNPSHSYFEIELDQKLVGSQALIFSGDGKHMETIKNLPNTFRIGSNYITGFYILEIITENGILSKKLIKQ